MTKREKDFDLQTPKRSKGSETCHLKAFCESSKCCSDGCDVKSVRSSLLQKRIPIGLSLVFQDGSVPGIKRSRCQKRTSAGVRESWHQKFVIPDIMFCCRGSKQEGTRKMSGHRSIQALRMNEMVSTDQQNAVLKVLMAKLPLRKVNKAMEFRITSHVAMVL